MDPSRTGDPDEARAGSRLPAGTSSVPADADGGPADLAALPSLSATQGLEKRAWPEWARGGDSEVERLAPRRAPATIDLSRVLIRWSLWRDRAPARPRAARNGVAWVVAIAVTTSVVVSLITTSIMVLLASRWLPGQRPAPAQVSDWAPVVTVFYEPLHPEPVPVPPPELPLVQAAPVPPPALPVVHPETPASQAPRQPAGAMTATQVRPPTTQSKPPASASGPAKVEAPARPSTVAPRTSRPESSEFVVTSEPEGASVTINGVGYGLTPITVRFLPPGARRIRATKSGYQSQEHVVAAEAAGSTASVRIVLAELPGSRGSQ